MGSFRIGLIILVAVLTIVAVISACTSVTQAQARSASDYYYEMNRPWEYRYDNGVRCYVSRERTMLQCLIVPD